MHSISLSWFWPFNRGYTKLHAKDQPLIRLICSFGDSCGENNKSVQQDSNQPVPGQGDDTSGSSQHPDSSSEQTKTSPDNSDPKKAPKQVKQLEKTLPRFGPLYGKDTETIKIAKEEAWQFIVDKSPVEKRDSLLGTYLSAINKVEKGARNTYDPKSVEKLDQSQFKKMLLIDGCFFLLLALYTIGGFQLLGSEKHIIFGKDKEKDISRWIEAMFFVGNQIPCVVLRQLMKQSFFQGIIRRGKENKIWVLPSDPPKMVLYLLLVSPELDKSSRWQKIKQSISSILPGGKEVPYFREKPTDLLHAFHCLVLGPGIYDPMSYHSEDVDHDLEAGKDSHEDDYPGTKSGHHQQLSRYLSGTIPSRHSRGVIMVIQGEGIAEQWKAGTGSDDFPSATELKQSGIKLARATKGIREIQFKKKWFLLPRLYVPPFTYDDNTERLLECLKNYEIVQKLDKKEREVGAYIRFMRDLVQTQEDVMILEKSKIIELKKKNHKHCDSNNLNHTLPRMLRRLCSSEVVDFTQNLRHARTAIQNYSAPPWRMLNVVAILTAVQTVFTIIAYLLPRK